MNILDSFYILFKSNAKEAKKDVEDFGKATRQTQDQINEADQSANKLGLSFQKLALAGVAAMEVYAGLGKLKDGIINAVNYNAQIEKTSKLTNIASRELSLMNDAISRAGGSNGGKEYLDFITSLNQKYAALGTNDRIKKVNEDLFKFADKFAEMERNAPGSSQALAAKLGIGPDLWLGMKDGSAVLQMNIDRMSKFDNTTQATTQASFALKQQWEEIGTEFQSIWNDLIPFAKFFTDFLQVWIKGFRILAGLAESIWNFHINEDLKKMFKDDFGGGAGDSIASATTGSTGSANGAAPTSANQAESRAFWKSQGYSDSQIAALLANENAESGFRSNAVGDGGRAKGIFQWHPPRRANILAGTGIDVENASHAEQLRAAAWELEQTGYAAKLRNTSTPGQGAAVLTKYEAPANAGYQAFARGKSADSYFAQMMSQGQGAIGAADSAQMPVSNNSSKNVSVGTININTKATDANGIALDLHGALNQHLSTTVGAFDDGVKY